MLETKLTYEDYIKVMMLATTNAAVKLIARSQSISARSNTRSRLRSPKDG
jgi:hypothetical protein